MNESKTTEELRVILAQRFYEMEARHEDPQERQSLGEQIELEFINECIAQGRIEGAEAMFAAYKDKANREGVSPIVKVWLEKLDPREVVKGL